MPKAESPLSFSRPIDFEGTHSGGSVVIAQSPAKLLPELLRLGYSCQGLGGLGDLEPLGP